MTARSRGEVFFRAMMTLAAFVALTGGVRAASIVQVVGFAFAEHGTNFEDYQQFDPTLGTLTQVSINVSGGATRANFSSRT